MLESGNLRILATKNVLTGVESYNNKPPGVNIFQNSMITGLWGGGGMDAWKKYKK